MSASSIPPDASVAATLEAQFLRTIVQNPYNAAILQRLPQLAAPQACLVAGCLFQTVWNAQTARPLTENIHDYDVFYFDDSDLSWDAEDRVIRRAAQLFADLPVTVEVRNQARVHLWYQQKFGVAYAPLNSCQEGIDRFLIACTCIGVTPHGPAAQDLHVYATHGLMPMYAGILQANPRNFQPALFLAKAQSQQRRWPGLRIQTTLA